MREEDKEHKEANKKSKELWKTTQDKKKLEAKELDLAKNLRNERNKGTAAEAQRKAVMADLQKTKFDNTNAQKKLEWDIQARLQKQIAKVRDAVSEMESYYERLESGKQDLCKD